MSLAGLVVGFVTTTQTVKIWFYYLIGWVGLVVSTILVGLVSLVSFVVWLVW